MKCSLHSSTGLPSRLSVLITSVLVSPMANPSAPTDPAPSPAAETSSTATPATEASSTETPSTEAPPSYVKLAMRNMVRKGGKSLFHFSLTVTALLGLLVGLAYLTR